MKSITDEMESVTWSVYPSLYNTIGYNSSDAFFIALEALTLFFFIFVVAYAIPFFFRKNRKHHLPAYPTHPFDF